MIRLDLAPVAYPLLDEQWLPGLRPYPHQAKTLRLVKQAVEQKTFLCVLNTAATGGGKTLASFAYTLLENVPAIGIYPTNELIEDQLRALRGAVGALGPQLAVDSAHFLQIDSRSLDCMELEYEQRGHSPTLDIILGWETSILTNPDIVYLTFFGHYVPGNADQYLKGLAAKLHQKLLQHDLFIFDEFHLYDAKQIGNVVTMLGTMHALQPDRGKAFIFSSATPLDAMVDLLERMGIPVQTVQAEPAEPHAPNRRTVAHPLELLVIPADLTAWKAAEAIQANIELVDSFVEQHPGARGVFILDSVAGALRMSSSLQSKFGREQVGEVHGLSSPEARRDALRRRFTVGTSTIEVGIDFRDEHEKDLLLFEARTAAQFVQRLGRIARHQKQAEIPNRAIALVPEYVHNFLLNRFGECAQTDRSQLTQVVFEAYRTPNQFEGYLRRYTPVEAYALKEFVSGQFQPDLRPRVDSALSQVVRAVGEEDQAAQLHRLLKRERMLAPLHTFRGQGLEAALWDKREDAGCPIKTYDLLFVLRRGVFKELDPKEFMRRVDEWLKEHPEDAHPTRRRLTQISTDPDDLMGVYGYFELNGILPETRQVWFECYKPDIKEWQKITTIEGLELGMQPHCPIVRTNKVLSNKRLVCWLGAQPPFALKFAHGLPPLFELYELRIKGPTGFVVQKASIALNLSAYYMDSLQQEGDLHAH